MKEARTAGRINGILVASGAWHDIDFARLEILKLLAEFDRVRIRVLKIMKTWRPSPRPTSWSATPAMWCRLWRRRRSA